MQIVTKFPFCYGLITETQPDSRLSRSLCTVVPQSQQYANVRAIVCAFVRANDTSEYYSVDLIPPAWPILNDGRSKGGVGSMHAFSRLKRAEFGDLLVSEK